MSNLELKHVAIIMDGNGRWANERFRPRVWGHVRGSMVVSEIVEAADDLKIKALTLYAFSTENWSRPLTEIKVLFSLLHKFLQKEQERIIKNQVRFKVIGDVSHLPLETKNLIDSLTDKTKNFLGLKLTFAFGYGGRQEICQALQKITDNNNKLITQELIEQNLETHDLGDVDLLIRTGGEYRISNFLIWQCAYAELFFTETKWPNFSRKEFIEIIDQVKLRQRRFGMTSSCASLKDAKNNVDKNREALKIQGNS